MQQLANFGSWLRKSFAAVTSSGVRRSDQRAAAVDLSDIAEKGFPANGQALTGMVVDLKTLKLAAQASFRGADLSKLQIAMTVDVNDQESRAYMADYLIPLRTAGCDLTQVKLTGSIDIPKQWMSERTTTPAQILPLLSSIQMSHTAARTQNPMVVEHLNIQGTLDVADEHMLSILRSVADRDPGPAKLDNVKLVGNLGAVVRLQVISDIAALERLGADTAGVDVDMKGRTLTGEVTDLKDLELAERAAAKGADVSKLRVAMTIDLSDPAGREAVWDHLTFLRLRGCDLTQVRLTGSIDLQQKGPGNDPQRILLALSAIQDDRGGARTKHPMSVADLTVQGTLDVADERTLSMLRNLADREPGPMNLGAVKLVGDFGTGNLPQALSHVTVLKRLGANTDGLEDPG